MALVFDAPTPDPDLRPEPTDGCTGLPGCGCWDCDLPNRVTRRSRLAAVTRQAAA